MSESAHGDGHGDGHGDDVVDARGVLVGLIGDLRRLDSLGLSDPLPLVRWWAHRAESQLRRLDGDGL